MHGILRGIFSAAIALGLLASAAYGQGFNIPPRTTLTLPSLAPTGPTSGATGCTVANTSTDLAGNCTSSATSGSVTFQNTYNAAPNCLVVDATSAATVPQLTYTVTTTQITISTMTSGHVIRWVCFPGPNF